MKNEKIDFGVLLEILYDENGINQKFLAGELKVHRATVGRWEDGGTIKPSNLQKIAKIFKVEFAAFSKGEIKYLNSIEKRGNPKSNSKTIDTSYYRSLETAVDFTEKYFNLIIDSVEKIKKKKGELVVIDYPQVALNSFGTSKNRGESNNERIMYHKKYNEYYSLIEKLLLERKFKYEIYYQCPVALSPISGRYNESESILNLLDLINEASIKHICFLHENGLFKGNVHLYPTPIKPHSLIFIDQETVLAGEVFFTRKTNYGHLSFPDTIYKLDRDLGKKRILAEDERFFW